MNGASFGTFVSLDPGCMMRMDGRFPTFHEATRYEAPKVEPKGHIQPTTSLSNAHTWLLIIKYHVRYSGGTIRT